MISGLIISGICLFVALVVGLWLKYSREVDEMVNDTGPLGLLIYGTLFVVLLGIGILSLLIVGIVQFLQMFI